MERYIYLILSSSSSLPAKIIKFAINNELNHTSLSLDSSLNKMFSFGRIKVNQPFNAGFVLEDKDKGFYQKFTDTKILLYRIPVDERTFNNVTDYLYECLYSKEELKYNYIGAILSKIKISVPRVNKYFCSEFTAGIIQENNVRDFKVNAHTCMPSDFLELDNIELLYEGMLSEYDCKLLAEL